MKKVSKAFHKKEKKSLQKGFVNRTTVGKSRDSIQRMLFTAKRLNEGYLQALPTSKS